MGKGLRAAIEKINAPLRKAAEEGAARWMALSPEERQQRLQAGIRQLHEQIPEQGRAQLAKFVKLPPQGVHTVPACPGCRLGYHGCDCRPGELLDEFLARCAAGEV